MKMIAVVILGVLSLAATVTATEHPRWKEYRFYCASQRVELERSVNYYMQPISENKDGGWQPLGGVVIVPSNSKSHPDELCQVLVR